LARYQKVAIPINGRRGALHADFPGELLKRHSHPTRHGTDIGYGIATVDEEMDIVLFRLDFGNTNNYGPANALTLFEAFKIYGGQIHEVEAFAVWMN
jgi:hypothetical protein